MALLVIAEATLFRDGLAALLGTRLPSQRVHYLLPALPFQPDWAVPDWSAPGCGIPKDPDCILLDLGPGTLAPAAPVPGSLAFGSVAPGSLAFGSATPGAAAPGAAAPGSAVPGAAAHSDLLTVLRERFPTQPLIGLADSNDQQGIERAFAAGARLCILKSAPPDVLISALQVASSISVCLPQGTRNGRASTLPRPKNEPRREVLASARTCPADLGLTPKQAQVLDLLLQGKSAKLIARDLGLCTGTVKSHTTAVLRALNVSTRVQAILAARQMGLQTEASHPP